MTPPKPKPKAKPTDENELNALVECWAEINPLSKPAQKRIVEFFASKVDPGTRVEWNTYR